MYTQGAHLGRGLCLLLRLTLLVSLSLPALDIYIVCSFELLHCYYHYIPVFFNVKVHMHSTAYHWWVFGYRAPSCLKNISIFGSILITANMALHRNNAHIIHHQMDATWSVGLMKNYFSHPHSLVIKCWVCTTILFSDSIIPRGPQVLHFIMFFPRWVGYMHDGVSCHHIMSVIDHTYIRWPFVVATYPSL